MSAESRVGSDMMTVLTGATPAECLLIESCVGSDMMTVLTGVAPAECLLNLVLAVI